MPHAIIALRLGAVSSAFLLCACSGLTDAQKDHCNSDSDCNPGRTCSPQNICMNLPADGGSPAIEAGDVDATANPNPNPVDDAGAPPQQDAEAVVEPTDARAHTQDAYEVVTQDSGGKPAEPAACGVPDGTVRHFTSLDQAYQAVVGRWLFCSGEPSNTNDGPIEFTAHQHWYLLVRDTSGQLVRVTGFDALGGSGTFQFYPAPHLGLDASAPFDLTSLDLELDYSGGSSLTSNFSFSDVPADATPAIASKMLFGPGIYVPAQ
jgi:hypothetical protein